MQRSWNVCHPTIEVFYSFLFSSCRPFAHKEDVNFTIQFESRSVTIEQIHLDLEYSAFINHMDPDEIEEELLESLSEKEPSKEDIHKIIMQEKGRKRNPTPSKIDP